MIMSTTIETENNKAKRIEMARDAVEKIRKRTQRKAYLEANPREAKMTLEEILGDARHCTSLKDFRINFPQSYYCAVNGEHMEEVNKLLFGIEKAIKMKQKKEFNAKHYKKPSGYKITKWTKDKILERASQCSDSKEFRIKHNGAYQAAARMGILIEINNSYPRTRKYNPRPNRVSKWNPEKIYKAFEEAGTLKKLRQDNPLAYHNAWALGMTPELKLKSKINGSR